MSAVNRNAIVAVWRRQLESLLGNPLGYVFILAYVLVAGGFLFIPGSFFARNVADLGPLLEIMPWLLVILVPAIAMGSWATERELGTDEQVLTLPLSETDAVLGKWLAVVSFFTLALVCSLSNVVALLWLGDPDLGLILANYVGWWFAGLVFAALGLLASAMVALPAAAFVLGSFFCALAMLAARAAEWFDPFNRGLVSLGSAAVALALVCCVLGAAVLVMSSARLRRTHRRMVVANSIALVGLAITVFNLSVWADRRGVELDVTAERLSSLSPASLKVVRSVQDPVTIAAFISKQLPPELILKGKQVENMLKVLDRRMGDRLTLHLFRPSDPLDEAGSLATQHYGLEPRKVVVDTVTGREEAEVFLGVAVTSGANTERIDHFDPGLSVEYELVRAIRTAASAKRKLVGIAKTDFKLLGGFDYATRQIREDWQVVKEWRKQYDVREVALDVPVGEDVEVLVVPQPSSLTDDQLVNLHDYIWAGRPALILEDPLPMFSGPQLGSSQPREQQNPMFGGPPPPEQPAKGDLQPLLAALGLRMELDAIAWSDYNPSHQFRNLWPPSLVWSFKSKEGIVQAPATTGIESVLLPWPGTVREAPGRNAELTVTPLITPIPGSPWGHHRYDEHFMMSFFGMQKVTPRLNTAESGPEPYLAVEITGKMKRAYPRADAERREGGGEKSGEAAGESTSPSGDEEASQGAAEGEETGVGELSETPVHVIFVADTDLAHDEFFLFYRNESDVLSEDELRFLLELRNVQFLSNAIDALAGDDDLLTLRTRRRKPRPLEMLEQVLVKTQTTLSDSETDARDEADAKIQKLRGDFQARLSTIDERTDLDENAKQQLRAQVERSAQRRLDSDIEDINRQKNLKIREAKIVQQRAIEGVRDRVRSLSLGLPAVVLGCLALTVFANRKRSERRIVPTSRQRSQS